MLRELSVSEQRYQAVLMVIEDGLAVTGAAAKAGVSRQCLRCWLSRYAAGGLEGLADRSRRPASCPHQMSPVVEVRHYGWFSKRPAFRLGLGLLGGKWKLRSAEQGA